MAILIPEYYFDNLYPIILHCLVYGICVSGELSVGFLLMQLCIQYANIRCSYVLKCGLRLRVGKSVYN
jgi:hypothetical protein